VLSVGSFAVMLWISALPDNARVPPVIIGALAFLGLGMCLGAGFTANGNRGS
jgi:hypothetical protein